MEAIKEQLLVRYVPPVLEELHDARGMGYMKGGKPARALMDREYD